MGGSPSYLLTVHEPFDRPLEAAAEHHYRVDIAGPTYLRIAIEQAGIEVSAALTAADGTIVATANGPHGWRKIKRISVVIEEPGQFTLRVGTTAGVQGAGRYRVEIAELRPAAISDRDRVDAENAQFEGERLAEEGGPAAWRAAVRHFDTAVNSWRSAEDSKGELTTINSQAEVLLNLEDTDRVTCLCDRALNLARKVGDLGAEATALLCDGNLAASGADKRASFKIAEQLREALGDIQGKVEALNLLAVAALNDGEYDQGLATQRLAYDLEEDGDLVRKARSATEIGGLRFLLGDAGGALKTLTESLEMSRKIGDFEGEANALSYLARVQQADGRLQEAVSDETAALQIYKRLGRARDEAWAIRDLGNAEEYLGELASARQRDSEALALFASFPNERDGHMGALLQLASVERSEGELQSALSHDLEALAISRSGNPSPYEATALYALGQVYHQQREWAHAFDALNQAAALTESSRDAYHSAQILIEKAEVYRDSGDLDNAAKQLAHALEVARGGQLEAAGRAAQASLERQAGRFWEAKGAIEKALAITEAQLQEVISPNRRISFMAKRHRYYELYIDVLMRLDHSRPGEGYASQAFQASERSRARGLLDLLFEDRGDGWRTIAPELARRHDELEIRIGDLLRQLLELSLRLPAVPDSEGLERKLRGFRDESQRVGEQIRLVRGKGLSMPHAAPLTVPEIQQRLDQRTALLEYSVGSDDSYLFVVTNDGLTAFKLPDSSGRLRSLVKQLQPALRSDGYRLLAPFTAGSRALYLGLIGPAEQVLTGKTQLLIAPDGPLNSLSFEVLVTRPTAAANYDLPYLIRDRSVAYVPSAGVLAHLDSLPVPRWSVQFIGFGDPLFDFGGGREAQPVSATSGRPRSLLAGSAVGEASSIMRAFRQAGLDRLPSLAHSRREVEAIAALFSRDQTLVYLGAEASEERVKGDPEIPRARFVHFAAHGLLSEDPELSGLVLARGAGSSDDGLLAVREISKLKLSADLVVLSGCQTGLGKEVTGEGIIGLPRAFVYAGAASVLVSLWQVDDKSTELLMVAFYKHLAATHDKAEALRLAKLELIQNHRYAFPYYWAPFVLIGRPQ